MGNLKDINTIDECPHCGSDFGYYKKAFVKGRIHDNTLFERDKHTGQREKYNYEMYDNLKWSKETKTCYCMECDKAIGITPPEGVC
jgi:hypothetical protein